jgi:iron complex outermembrane receptor protein
MFAHLPAQIVPGGSRRLHGVKGTMIIGVQLMGQTNLRAWLIGTIFTSYTLSLAGVAFAQTGAPAATPVEASTKATLQANPGQLETITVTARRREEKLQNVPLQITALTGKTLSDAGATELRDITFLTPGLTLNSNGAQADETPVIRGQVDIGNAAIGRNNVPVFFDGYYISQSSAIDFGLINLARVEVVEGPVSSLYGHSGYAGAINYVTAKPSPDEYSTGIETTLGNYNRENVKFDASGPLIKGILTGGISGSYDNFNGTFHDSSTNQNAGGDQRKDIFGNLDFTPTPNLEIRPEIYYGSDFFGPTPERAGAANCGDLAPFSYASTACGEIPNSSFGPVDVASARDGQTGNNRTVLVTGLNVNYTTPYGTITSQTGYNNIRSTQFSEFDQSSFGEPVQTYLIPPGGVNYTVPPGGFFGNGNLGPVVNLPLHFGYHQSEKDFSEELRFASLQDQPFRYMIGGYYSNSQLVQDLHLGIDTTGVPAGYSISSPFATPPGQKYSGQQTLDELDDSLKAVYGGADYDIIPNLTVSGQLRWQEEDEAFEQPYASFIPYEPGYNTGAPSTFNPAGPGQRTKFYSVTTRDSVSYKPLPGIMVYVSVANGEKGGGFNNYNFTPGTTFSKFAPETNLTEEGGVKTTLLDNHLQLNGDVFHIQTQNDQISAPANSNVAGNFSTSNFGGVTTYGFEGSIAAKPVDGVTFTSGFAYAAPRFDSNSYDFSNVTACSFIQSCAGRITTVGANKAVSLKGLRPPYESDVTFNASLALIYPVYKQYNWFGRIDYRFQSSQFYEYPDDFGHYGDLNNVNLRTGISRGPASLTFYIDNATNNMTPVSAQDFSDTGSASLARANYYPVVLLPEGRTFGVTLKYRFTAPAF